MRGYERRLRKLTLYSARMLSWYSPAKEAWKHPLFVEETAAGWLPCEEVRIYPAQGALSSLASDKTHGRDFTMSYLGQERCKHTSARKVARTEGTPVVDVTAVEDAILRRTRRTRTAMHVDGEQVLLCVHLTACHASVASLLQPARHIRDPPCWFACSARHHGPMTQRKIAWEKYPHM